MLSNKNTIIEISQSSSLLNVNDQAFNYIKLKLGWGLDISLTGVYPFNLYVIRADGINPVNIPYNAMRWSFKVTNSLPSN